MPKKATEDKVQETPEVVEVKLAAEKQAPKSLVYISKGVVEFIDGVAKVSPEVADELRKLGIIE